MSASLRRRALAEAVGSAALVAVVVGSGIQAAELSRDVGVQLLANSHAAAEIARSYRVPWSAILSMHGLVRRAWP